MQTQLFERIRWGRALTLILVLVLVVTGLSPAGNTRQAVAMGMGTDGMVCTTSPTATFTLTTKTGYIGLPDDNIVYM